MFQAEIERLEKEGSKQVEEEIAFVQKQIWEQLHGPSKNAESNAGEFRIKIRWKAQESDPLNSGYDYDSLHRMFSKVKILILIIL